MDDAERKSCQVREQKSTNDLQPKHAGKFQNFEVASMGEEE